MSVLSKSLFMVTAAAATAAGAAHGQAADRYLTWETKAARQAEQAQHVSDPQPQPQPQPRSGPYYGIPASPYGQVGNPYRQMLSWPGKGAVQQQASIEPLPQQPVHTPAPVVAPAVSAPRPVPRPQPVTVAPAPQPQPSQRPAPRPEPSVRPAPAPQPAPRPEPLASARVAPEPPAPPSRPAPQPQPQPQPQPPVQGSGVVMDSGYELPANSKYAARIAAARAAQDQESAQGQTQDQTQDQAVGAPAEAAAAPSPTVPAETQSLASHETDQVFIPGEQITNAMTQEPRRYSLHRQYGMQPDRILVDPTPNGAILETTFDALEPAESAEDSEETP